MLLTCIAYNWSKVKYLFFSRSDVSLINSIYSNFYSYKYYDTEKIHLKIMLKSLILHYRINIFSNIFVRSSHAWVIRKTSAGKPHKLTPCLDQLPALMLKTYYKKILNSNFSVYKYIFLSWNSWWWILSNISPKIKTNLFNICNRKFNHSLYYEHYIFNILVQNLAI